MGVIREFRCPSCERTWELWVGHGMKHGMLGRVMEAFPVDIQKEILAGTEAGTGKMLPLFSFNYEASVCGQCGNMVALPVLQLIESGQRYTGRCPECGGEPEPLGKDSRIGCPGCQQGILQVQDTGHWD